MSGPGSIVCTTSVQGLIGFPMTAAYSITKHGIVGMVKASAKEMGEKGIRINAIAPYEETCLRSPETLKVNATTEVQ